MGCCGECSSFIEGGFLHDGYCATLTDWKGDPKKVNYSNSCDHFTARITAKKSGFKGGCFLTSACTEYMGKPDDCEELTKLRAFRDSYMKQSESGKKLVEEYYRIAPLIVEKINISEDKNKIYEDIYQTILKCIVAIDGGNNSKAQEMYIQMVNKYRERFSV